MASTSTFLMIGLRSSCLMAFVLLLAMARFRRAFRFNSVTPMIVSFFIYQFNFEVQNYGFFGQDCRINRIF